MSLRSLCFILCLLVASKLLAQQSRIDSLEAIVKLNQKDLNTIKSLNYLAIEYSRKDSDKSKKYLWLAKSLLLTVKDERAMSSTYSQLALIYQNQAQIDSANYYAQLLKSIANTSTGPDSDIIKGNYYSTMGLIHKKRGNIGESLPFFIKSYEASLAAGNLNASSGQAINIGNIYLGLSDFNLALNYYLEALQGFEQTQNKNGQSFCYQNIGECYIELQQYASAISYINKSISLKKEMNDTRGLGNAEQSLGRIYMGLGSYEKSLLHYHKALRIVQDLKLSTEEVKVNLNLGKIFSLKEDTEKALSYFEKSKHLAKKLGDSSSVIAADLEILAIKEATSKVKENAETALKDIQTLKESGAISKEAAGYKNLAAYYTNLKQYDKALEYTNLYVKLNDSIRNNDVQTQFKTIEEKYNKANNEKQIALLQKDQIIKNEKLKQQRFWLVLSGLVILFISLGVWMFMYRNRMQQKMQEVELRNQLAADLHDEVGSSLSSIYMLSQMAAQQQFENKQSILDKVAANAHETMDKMSDIVWMLKPNDEAYGIGLLERMENFASDLCASKNIQHTFQVMGMDSVKLSMQQSKNLYLIFKEAVNNAIKYSNTSVLDIVIHAKQKKLEMTIKDEGIGFSDTEVKGGNGLHNMKNRAGELKGTLAIESVKNKGTQITLQFPLA